MIVHPQEHPSEGELQDLIDDVCEESHARSLEAHALACAACAVRLTRLRVLVAQAAALPRTVDPPAELWERVRAEIDARKVVPLEPFVRTAHAKRLTTGGGGQRWLTRAATLLLVAGLSSAATAAWLRRGDSPARQTGLATTATPAITARTVATIGVDPLAHYAADITALEANLAASRGRLSPRTLTIVEQSLRVIDAAILEARAALASDPGNRHVRDLLEASYGQKVDLLRRTTELSSS